MPAERVQSTGASAYHGSGALAYPVNAAKSLLTAFVFGWSAPSTRSESASVRSRSGIALAVRPASR